MKAKQVNENISNILKPKSDKEIEESKNLLLNDLREKTKNPNINSEEFSWILMNIYGDRKQMINDLMDEGLDPNDLIVLITDDLDGGRNTPRYKEKILNIMFKVIEKNKDEFDPNDLW